ncbi:conserved hypothetical protein [Theileria equi strain WA]|uniref:Uncharacterized protein n=1 Tax=Theileria equi strain WA TaxID=1537102 RepID=L1LDJ3_THEEQ|nr:conserved hypothetical protein [Theileria equi strain WA]EKX73421.1 conserved hypothetical protein [Theileria equi strain WA]|eukprot:XP_004832873.1 conserved hypothetical protein [Theileria equi strain WA]
MQSKPLKSKMSQRVLYRAILHGPMTWKTSHSGGQVCDEAPYLVAFEPMGSVVVLAQGTMVLPQLFIYGTKGEERQVLSVFVFAKATVAKEFVSALYKAIDRRFKLLDILQSPPLLELVKKSLSSFHLPLEIVLRKIDYSLARRSHSLRKDTASTKFGGPLSEHNTTGIIDSYNLRVGLGEGIPSIKDLTELNQHVLKCLDRKGANVNRLSLSFYKLGTLGSGDTSAINMPHRLGCMTPGPLMQTPSVYQVPNGTKSLFGDVPRNVARSITSGMSKPGECRLKVTKSAMGTRDCGKSVDRVIDHSIDLDRLRNMSTDDAGQSFVALDSIRATIQSTDRPLDLSKTSEGGQEDDVVSGVNDATNVPSVDNVKSTGNEDYKTLVEDLKRVSEENLRMKQANQKYKTRNSKLNEQIELLKREHERQLVTLKNEHEHVIKNLKSEHEYELESVRNDCEDEMDDMRRDCLRELDYMAGQHENHISTTKHELNETRMLLKEAHLTIQSMEEEIAKSAAQEQNLATSLNEHARLMKRLKHVEEKYSQVSSLLKKGEEDSEKYVELQEQAAKMQAKIERLDEENRDLCAKLDQAQRDLEEMEDKEEKLRTKLSKSREKIENLTSGNTRTAEVEQENRSLHTKIDSLVDKLEAMQEQKSSLVAELEAEERAKLELECRVENMKICIEKLTRSIEEHERSGSRLGSKLELLESNNGALLKKLEDAKLELSNANATKRQLQKSFEALEKTNESLEKNVKSLERSNSSLEKRNGDLNKALLDMERACESLRSSNGFSELEELKNGYGLLKEENVKLQSAHAELQRKLAGLEKTNSGLERRNAELTTKLDDSKGTIKELKGKIAKLDAKNAELKRDVESLGKCDVQLKKRIQSLETSNAETKKKLELEVIKTGDLKEKLEVAESHKIKWKKETERVKMEIVQVENELARVEKESKRSKTEFVQIDRERTKLEKELGKVTGDLKEVKRRNMTLCARLFQSMVRQKKQERETVLLRARCTFASQRAASGKNLSRLLISNILKTKARLAKRTCQFAKIVDALSIERPATLSAIMDGIEKLQIASEPCKRCEVQDKEAQNRERRNEKEIERLKKSFMRACNERDEKIKDLEVKLKNYNKTSKNERMLMNENEKLKNQLRIERDNLYSLEDDVKVQIETEMIRSSNEKNALYAKQYELIMQNTSLQKENERLKHTLSLMSTHGDETYLSTRSGADVLDEKFGRMHSIFNVDGGASIDKYSTIDKPNVAKYGHVVVDGYGRIEGYGSTDKQPRRRDAERVSDKYDDDDGYFAVQGPLYRGEEEKGYVNRTPYITVPPYY